MKIHSVAAELFHTDSWTEYDEAVSRFCSSANARKKVHTLTNFSTNFGFTSARNRGVSAYVHTKQRITSEGRLFSGAGTR
jgi:hypothetical protein